MIFFITTIVPSSNFLTELRDIQKELFQSYMCIPSPFPLLITFMKKECPKRPTRKDISELYPPEISIENYKCINNELVLSVKETLPFDIDRSLPMNNTQQSSGFVISYTDNSDHLDLIRFPVPSTGSFSSYSLVCYEVTSLEKDPYWLNMSWNKIWEVKKGKKKI